MSFLCRSGELIVAALFVAIAHFDLMGEHKAHDGQRNKGHNEAHRRRSDSHSRSTLAAGRWRSSTATLEPARSLARSPRKNILAFPRGFFPSVTRLCTVQTKNKSVAYGSSETGSGSFFLWFVSPPPPTPTVTRRDFCDRLEFHRDSLY